MRKICILICILLCCGCKARYEIKFNDNKIDDQLSVTYSKADEMFRSFAPDPLYALDNIPYDLKINDIGDYINLNYAHSFVDDEYSKAFVPSSCFSSFNFIKEDDRYYFIADGEFLCRHVANVYYDSLDIVISTNHVVVQDNADEKKNGKYIWHISPDSETFSLRFITSTKVKGNNSIFYLVGFSLFFIAGSIFLVVKKIKSKNEI